MSNPKFTFGQKVTDGKIIGIIRHREWYSHEYKYSYVVKPDDRSIKDVKRWEEELSPVEEKRKPTLAEAKEAARKVGCSLTKKNGEYRVNFKGGAETTAAYTDDIEDAIGTAQAMARHQAERRYPEAAKTQH